MKDLLNIAMGEYGVSEIPGSKHNERIVNYSKEIGYGGIVNDETAWCSIFANWVAMKALCERSKKLNARSWLSVGYSPPKPEMGDIVVFWRSSPSSWKGHVAFYISTSEDGKYIYCLGGNQKNMVCISAYPSERVLQFRRI